MIKATSDNSGLLLCSFDTPGILPIECSRLPLEFISRYPISVPQHPEYHCFTLGMNSPAEKVVPMRKRVAKACETCRAMKSKVTTAQALGGPTRVLRHQVADCTILCYSAMGGTRLAASA